MTFKIDLHVHTYNSGDNNADPEEAVIRAIERGLDGIAFTEHYSYAASAFADRLRERYEGRILVLRGVEFSTAEGHCLVFGTDTDQHALKYAPARDVISVVNRSGGVAIPSHPYRTVNSLGDLVLALEGLCGLEGCNGCNMHPYNVKAITAAQRLQLPYTGGSDAHSPEDVGSCYTEFSAPVTEANFIEQLKAGNYRGVDVRKISRMQINTF